MRAHGSAAVIFAYDDSGDLTNSANSTRALKAGGVSLTFKDLNDRSVAPIRSRRREFSSE